MDEILARSRALRSMSFALRCEARDNVEQLRARVAERQAVSDAVHAARLSKAGGLDPVIAQLAEGRPE